jgi:resuscitation-promoting factor RpfA
VLVCPQLYLHGGGLPPVEPPLLPELDDEDELDEDDELELDDEDELLDPPVLLVVVLVMPPVEVEVEPPLVEVEPPLVELPPEDVEVELPVLPVVVLLLSIRMSTLPPPLLPLLPKNPPKKPPPKPPKPLVPPITIGWPPPVATIGCCGSCGSGIGTIAYCSSHSSWHSRSTTRRMVRSRGGTTRWARRCLMYRGRSVFTSLAEW